MVLSIRLAVLCLLLTGARGQQPASPSNAQPDRPGLCDKSFTQLELNECTAKQFKVIDARLDALYREISADLSRDKAKGAVALDKLKATQQAWLKYRELHCDAARHQFEGGSMAPMIWADCMTGVTLNRIEELKFAYPVEGQPRD